MQFPQDFPASIFIVQHVLASAPGYLAKILDRIGPLPATNARHGERFAPGHIYVAPPDHHLLVMPGHLQVTRGPRENRMRPAIDPLFRSAAAAYGSRVVGVILSGSQNYGTAGLLAIKRCGGVAVVQEPTEAAYADMPLSAVKYVEVDHCVPIARLGAVLYKLTQEAPPEAPPVPPDIQAEVDITTHPLSDSHHKVEKLGELVSVSCPECGGPLREVQHSAVPRYRCRVGHAYTAESLLAGQSETLERALWTAVQTMEGRARLLLSMADKWQENHHGRVVTLYKSQAAELSEHAQALRLVLLQGTHPPAAIAPETDDSQSETHVSD